MRKLVLVLCLALVGCDSPLANDPVDMEGSWWGTISYDPNGETDHSRGADYFTAQLVQDGSKLSGTFQSEGQGSYPWECAGALTGTVSGSMIRLIFADAGCPWQDGPVTVRGGLGSNNSHAKLFTGKSGTRRFSLYPL